MSGRYTFDHIVGELRCPLCGAVSPADGSTQMITALRDQPALAYLAVGDPLPVDPERARAAGYLVLRAPAPGDDAVLLHTWVCPTCGTSFLWARVVVSGGAIANVEPVDLDAAAVAEAHYIVDDAAWIAAELAGAASPLDLSDEEAASVLRTRVQ